MLDHHFEHGRESMWISAKHVSCHIGEQRFLCEVIHEDYEALFASIDMPEGPHH